MRGDDLPCIRGGSVLPLESNPRWELGGTCQAPENDGPWGMRCHGLLLQRWKGVTRRSGHVHASVPRGRWIESSH